MKKRPENNTSGESGNDGANFLLGSGMSAARRIIQLGREIHYAAQRAKIEQKDRDALAIYAATGRLFENQDSTEAIARYDWKTPLLPVPGRIALLREGIGVIGTSISITPNIVKPSDADINLRTLEPKMPKRIFQATTNLKFVLAPNLPIYMPEDHYEVLRETQLTAFKTDAASSWEELVSMIHAGEIDGETAIPEQIGFHAISHADAETYATVLSNALALK